MRGYREQRRAPCPYPLHEETGIQRHAELNFSMQISEIDGQGVKQFIELGLAFLLWIARNRAFVVEQLEKALQFTLPSLDTYDVVVLR
jgi:uncharacterized protein YlxP (DUF503 family)